MRSGGFSKAIEISNAVLVEPTVIWCSAFVLFGDLFEPLYRCGFPESLCGFWPFLYSKGGVQQT